MQSRGFVSFVSESFRGSENSLTTSVFRLRPLKMPIPQRAKENYPQETIERFLIKSAKVGFCLAPILNVGQLVADSASGTRFHQAPAEHTRRRLNGDLKDSVKSTHTRLQRAVCAVLPCLCVASFKRKETRRMVTYVWEPFGKMDFARFQIP